MSIADIVGDYEAYEQTFFKGKRNRLAYFRNRTVFDPFFHTRNLKEDTGVLCCGATNKYFPREEADKYKQIWLEGYSFFSETPHYFVTSMPDNLWFATVVNGLLLSVQHISGDQDIFYLDELYPHFIRSMNEFHRHMVYHGFMSYSFIFSFDAKVAGIIRESFGEKLAENVDFVMQDLQEKDLKGFEIYDISHAHDYSTLVPTPLSSYLRRLNVRLDTPYVPGVSAHTDCFLGDKGNIHPLVFLISQDILGDNYRAFPGGKIIKVQAVPSSMLGEFDGKHSEFMLGQHSIKGEHLCFFSDTSFDWEHVLRWEKDILMLMAKGVIYNTSHLNLIESYSAPDSVFRGTGRDALIQHFSVFVFCNESRLLPFKDIACGPKERKKDKEVEKEESDMRSWCNKVDEKYNNAIKPSFYQQGKLLPSEPDNKDEFGKVRIEINPFSHANLSEIDKPVIVGDDIGLMLQTQYIKANTHFILHPACHAVAENKSLSLKLAMKNGVRVPETLFLDTIADVRDSLKQVETLGYPFYLKASIGGAGIGVTRINNRDEFFSQIDEVSDIKMSYVCQKLVPGADNQCVRVICIFGEIYVAYVRKGGKNGKASIASGGTIQKMVLTGKQVALVQKLLNMFKCDFVGFDFFLDDEEFIFNEVNPYYAGLSGPEMLGYDVKHDIYLATERMLLKKREGLSLWSNEEFVPLTQEEILTNMVCQNNDVNEYKIWALEKTGIPVRLECSRHISEIAVLSSCVRNPSFLFVKKQWIHKIKMSPVVDSVVFNTITGVNFDNLLSDVKWAYYGLSKDAFVFEYDGQDDDIPDDLASLITKIKESGLHIKNMVFAYDTKHIGSNEFQWFLIRVS